MTPTPTYFADWSDAEIAYYAKRQENLHDGRSWWKCELCERSVCYGPVCVACLTGEIERRKGEKK